MFKSPNGSGKHNVSGKNGPEFRAQVQIGFSSGGFVDNLSVKRTKMSKIVGNVVIFKNFSKAKA